MIRFKDWNTEALTGYKPISTFYMDFSIADAFGAGAVKDTYKRAMEGWKKDCKMLTELVMTLNWKIWEHYESKPRLADLYDALWREAAEYAENNLVDEELNYYYNTVD